MPIVMPAWLDASHWPAMTCSPRVGMVGQTKARKLKGRPEMAGTFSATM
jgi:hypothetical protein